MLKPVQNGPKEIVFKGKIVQIVQTPMLIGDKPVTFEKAERAPGTRLLIIKDKQILLTREYRTELDAYDYRLPGGKVFDTLTEYQDAQKDETSMLQAVESGAKKEALEEAGITVHSLDLLKVSKAGATVIWDLFYFTTTEFEEARNGQSLEAGEIIKPTWYSFEEAKQFCLEGKMSEDRSIGVLLPYLINNA
jgi:ADP-ribose pyrophosphatase